MSLVDIIIIGAVDLPVAGAAAGLLAVGTVVYLLTGADLEQVQDLLQASSLASPISHASLITSSSPWCTQLTYAESRLESEIRGDAPISGLAGGPPLSNGLHV